MKYFLWASAALLLLGACHASTHQQAGADTLTFRDFSSLFPVMKLPFSYTADSLRRKETDSSALRIKAVTAFVPDSILHQAFRKGEKIKYFPAGQLDGKHQVLLLLKAVSSHTTTAYLCAMDPEGRFRSALRVAAISSREPGHLLYMKMDDKDLVSLHDQQRVSTGRVVSKEDVYALGPNGSFTLILTNSTEPLSPDQLTNPLDTFPQKHKYSADYFDGKLSLVSIRDGGEPGTFRFFVHLTRDKGDCTGEVDGLGRFTGAHTGEYHEDNGPCGIRFTFSAGRVKLQEIGGCGAYRGIRCFFEGTFTEKRKKAKE